MSYQKFTKNIGILGLTQLIIALSGIIELSIITKLLGAHNYGIWTQLMVTIGLLVPVVVLGLPYTLVRFLAGEKDEKEIQDGFWSATTIVFTFSILVALLLSFFSPSISKLFGCPPFFISILAFIIVFECLNLLQLNVFRAFQEIKKYSLFTIAQKIIEVVLIGLAVFLGYGLLGAVLSLLFLKITFFLIMGSLIIKRIHFKVPNFLRIREYLSFGLPPVLADASSWILQSSDKYLVGFFLGTLFVGYYAPAYALGGCLAFLISPLAFLLPATLSKHYDENKIDEVKIYLKYSLKYFLMITVPAVFGLSILSKQLLTILSTTEIAQHSYYAVPFIAMSMIFLGVYVIFDQIIALKKKTIISGYIWLVAAIVNFGLNFIFIPRFGILGAAITTLVGYALAATLTWYYSFKELQFGIDWLFLLKSIFSSALMSSLIFWLNPIGLYKTLFAIIFGALTYFVLIFLLRGFSKNEIEFLKKLNR